MYSSFGFLYRDGTIQGHFRSVEDRSGITPVIADSESEPTDALHETIPSLPAIVQLHVFPEGSRKLVG